MTAKIIGTPIVHPFKIRPDNGQEGWNLFGDFTVGYTAGMKFKLGHNPFRENTVTFVFYGAGVGKAKYFTEKDGKLTEKEDGMAITYYQAGVLFTVEKVNFGGFVGFDAMLDKRNDWYYQSKPWFSGKHSSKYMGTLVI